MRNRIFLTACLILLFSAALLADSTQQSRAPVTGIPGVIVMWLICSKQKDKPIGGWLLYYYIQLYVGTLVSLVLVCFSIKNYDPSEWRNIPLYWLFLISVIPSVLMLLLNVVVSSVLLKKRQWEWVLYLRLILALEVGFAILGLAIDTVHFPDNLVFDVWSGFVSLIWLVYFVRSTRVVSVFNTHNWHTAPTLTA